MLDFITDLGLRKCLISEHFPWPFGLFVLLSNCVKMIGWNPEDVCLLCFPISYFR
jgi:hypothetical protein